MTPFPNSGSAPNISTILFSTGGETSCGYPSDWTFVRAGARDRLLVSQAIVLHSAREERLELPTPGFGDQCSTN